MKKKLKLTSLEMRSIKGGINDTTEASTGIKPISCWFCHCGGNAWKQGWSSGKMNRSKM
jgi:hypothetical protein